jgi:anti-sigma B factor antagonist
MLEAELERNTVPGKLVVVDLRELEFIDSTGLGVLVRAYVRSGEDGYRFGLVRGSGQVQRLLGLTGLADQLPIADSLEELRSET